MATTEDNTVFLAITSVVAIALAHYSNSVLMTRYIDKFEEQSKLHHFLLPRSLTHIVIMLGLLLAELSVLLIPLDVANRSSSIYGNIGCSSWNTACGGIDVAVLWQVVYMLIAFFVVSIIPFTIFFYESYEYKAGSGTDQGCWKQFKGAFCWQMIATVIVAIVLGVTYATPSTNEVALPITSIEGNNDPSYWGKYGHPFSTTDPMATLAAKLPTEKTVITFSVTFPVYLIGCMSFIGWFFFVIFAAVGLIAVPTDLINAYIETPKDSLDASQLNKKKNALVKRAEELAKSGALLKKQYRKNGAVDSKMFNRYKKAVYDLEKDSDNMDIVEELFKDASGSGFSALMAFLYLIFGIFAALITFFWILHICLYVLPVAIEAWNGNANGKPISLFLNAYFAVYDRTVPLFGALSVMIFTFYLQIAVISGNFKVGTRIFIIQIHPMRVGRTLPNSILVNISLILMTAPAISQFSTQAFADYIRMSDADLLFGAQIKYLSFLKPFFDHGIFTFVFLGFTVLSLLYYITCGRKVEGVDERKMLKMLEKINDTNELQPKKKWYQWS